MWGTGVSNTHFTFPCAQDGASLHISYFVLLSAAAGIYAVFTLRPEVRIPSYGPVRFRVYCLFSSSLFAPLLHGGLRSGLEALVDMKSLELYLGLVVIQFSGGVVYTARILERWFSGMFDLLG